VGPGSSEVRECYDKGCKNKITEPHEFNNWDLWCGECHAKAHGRDKETLLMRKERIKQASLQRIFRDGRAGKLKGML
jgi:hypothetical protein